MMKFGFALNALAGAALVATAVGFTDGDAKSLEISLDRTMRELETLVGLRDRIDKGDRDAIADVLKLSTAPAVDRKVDDARLDTLRVEVARLEMQRDGLAPLPKKSDADTKSKSTKNKADVTPDANLTAFEAVGFSADLVKQGEVLFRADRFNECIKVLERAPDDPRALYWTARSLEHLDKTDEAIAIYTRISAEKSAGWAGERARADLEFLKWKQSTEGTSKEPAKAPAKDTNHP
ncbi:MAG: hypothetical protein SGI72_16480 [Planctomycetota bacterium]|nr:hypothetical protein [Planctomycetota bacterium]